MQLEAACNHRWGCFNEELPVKKAVGGIVWRHQGNWYDHPRHCHTALEMNLVVSGRGSYEVEGQRHPLVAGSVLWIRPFEEHYVEERSSDFDMWIVAAEPVLFEQALEPKLRDALLPEKLSNGLSRLLNAADFRWLNQEIQRFSNSTSLDFLRAGLVYSLLGAWEATEATGEVSPGAVLSAPLQRAVALLEDDTQWSRENLAEAVNVTPERLGRLFQTELNVGFVDFRNRLRIQRFLEIQRHGQGTLLGACLEAGFGSYAQFHRVFTEVVGTAPSRSNIRNNRRSTRCDKTH